MTTTSINHYPCNDYLEWGSSGPPEPPLPPDACGVCGFSKSEHEEPDLWALMAGWQEWRKPNFDVQPAAWKEREHGAASMLAYLYEQGQLQPAAREEESDT